MLLVVVPILLAHLAEGATVVPCSDVKRDYHCCGDGACDGPERLDNCPEDCDFHFDRPVPPKAGEDDRPRIDCGGFADTCKACIADDRCSWCHNFHRCVPNVARACREASKNIPRMNSPFDQVGAGHAKGRCDWFFYEPWGLYVTSPDQQGVVPCDYDFDRSPSQQQQGSQEVQVSTIAEAIGAVAPCCGDGECNGIEARHSCPQDCGVDTAGSRKQYALAGITGGSRLFPRLEGGSHPAYHCHEAYDRKSPVQWFLGRPSKDLKNELTATGPARVIALPPGAEVLDIGCGDGRDTLFLASLGFRATGVDIGAPAIAKARKKQADAHGEHAAALATAQFLHFDVLQLPAPAAPVDFIWDNTIYCNLRIEFLGKVLSLLDRLTTPGRTPVDILQKTFIFFRSSALHCHTKLCYGPDPHSCVD